MVSEPHDQVDTALASARRTQILDAAAAVFATHGFHGATIKQIARVAGIADGTIYIYFPSKDALLLGLLDRLNESDRREADFEAGGEQDLRSFFVAYLRHRLAYLRPNLHIIQAVFPEVLANAELRRIYYERVIAPTIAIGEEHLRARVAAGELPPMDVPLMVRAMGGAIFGLLLFNLLGDTELEERWDELPEVLAQLLFDRIRR